MELTCQTLEFPGLTAAYTSSFCICINVQIFVCLFFKEMLWCSPEFIFKFFLVQHILCIQYIVSQCSHSSTLFQRYAFSFAFLCPALDSSHKKRVIHYNRCGCFYVKQGFVLWELGFSVVCMQSSSACLQRALHQYCILKACKAFLSKYFIVHTFMETLIMLFVKHMFLRNVKGGYECMSCFSEPLKKL